MVLGVVAFIYILLNILLYLFLYESILLYNFEYISIKYLFNQNCVLLDMLNVLYVYIYLQLYI